MNGQGWIIGVGHNLAISFTLVDRATAHRSWPFVASFSLSSAERPGWSGKDIVPRAVCPSLRLLTMLLNCVRGGGLDPWAPQKGKRVTQWWLFWALWENQNDSVWWVKRSHSWPSLWSLCFYDLWSRPISSWLDPKSHLWSQQLAIAGVLAFRICWFDFNVHMLEAGLLLFLLVFQLVFAGIRLLVFWLNDLELWRSDLSLTYIWLCSFPHLSFS